MLLLLVSFLTFANELYISEQRATLWNANDPGLTYNDCTNPVGDAVIPCERRIGWPEGGDSVTQTRATQRINGINYTLVRHNGKHGWVDDTTVDRSTKKIKTDTFMYSQAGLNFGRCRQAAEQLDQCQFSCIELKGEAEARCLRSCTAVGVEVSSCESKSYLRKDTTLTEVAPDRITLNNEEFYFVNYQKDGMNRSGWIYEGSLSKTSIEEEPSETDPNLATEGDATECIACEIAAANPEPPKSALQEHIQNIETGGFKGTAEIEKFACLHTDARIYGNERGFSKARFCAYYKNSRPSLKNQIAKAAAAFEIPEAIVACTLLVESGMYHRPNEKKHYRGMGQFGSKAVEDLKRYLDNDNQPYKRMWQRYTTRPTSDFNDNNIRNTRDVEAVVGATALYAKWFFVNRIPTTGCTGCSGSTTRPNSKDVDLFIAGYNWSPYGTGRIAKLSREQLRNDNIIPPPKETKGYLKKMDRCLEPGQFDKFTSDKINSSTRSRAEECNGPC